MKAKRSSNLPRYRLRRALTRGFLIESRAMIAASNAGAAAANAAGGSGIGSACLSRMGEGASGTGGVGVIHGGVGSHGSLAGAGSIDAIETEP